jgi:phage virion morphogenesis protein
MLDFTFTDTLTAKLEAGVRASVDFSPVMAAIADKMRSNAVLNFEAESGPDGVRWKPSQRAIEDGGLTLTDSGQLRQSIVAANDATSAIAGTNLVYAAIHQFGGRIAARPGSALRTPVGPRRSVTMPARPFLGFGDEDIAEFGQMLEDHLDRAMSGGRA